MKKITVKLTVICLMTLMLVAALTGCSSKGVDGYYVRTTSSGLHYALEIHGDTASLYYTPAGQTPIEASVETTEDGADLYFGQSPSTFLNEMNDHNPMHVKLSSDGTKLYLSSDVGNWSTDTYEVVTKNEFEELIAEFI